MDERTIEAGHPNAIAWEADQVQTAVRILEGDSRKTIDVALTASP